MKKLILLLGIVVGFTVLVQAQSTPAISRKQVTQTQRIKQGVRSGELTPAEARRSAAEQRHIHREKRRAKADGVVTPRERRHIKRDQKRASRDIYRQKHNAREW